MFSVTYYRKLQRLQIVFSFLEMLCMYVEEKWKIEGKLLYRSTLNFTVLCFTFYYFIFFCREVKILTCTLYEIIWWEEKIFILPINLVLIYCYYRASKKLEQKSQKRMHARRGKAFFVKTKNSLTKCYLCRRLHVL